MTGADRIALAGVGLILAGLILGSCGCESIPDTWDDLTGNDDTGDTTTTTTQPANEYDLTLTVTGIDSKYVYFDWAPRDYGWPSKVVKVSVNATVHMYRADGSGGKFDWIRTGGQSQKGLENIHHGYGGHTVPASGERVTFRWVSVDGNRRSNDAEAIWPE